jgi:hypothetical protein
MNLFNTSLVIPAEVGIEFTTTLDPHSTPALAGVKYEEA